MPKYSGPLEVISRSSDSTLNVRTGTFVSGKAIIQLHTWARCKPAFMRDDAKLGVQARRGRPPRAPSDPAEADKNPRPENELVSEPNTSCQELSQSTAD